MVTLSILLVIAGLGLIMTAKFISSNKYMFISGGLACALAVMFFILSLFYIVEPGQVGIEILFGKIQEYAPAGLNVKNPFANIIKLNLRTIKYEAKLAGATKDLQEIEIDVAINYRLDYEKIAELYNMVGIDYETKVIDPAVMNLSKAAVSTFPIADVIVKRNDMVKLIFESLKERLKQYYIILETVNLNNIAFSKAFSNAVEQKQIQEQNVQTAEYMRQQAMKQKETTILEAQAESEKQRLLRNTTSREVIDLKWIEKWNGQLPQIMTPGTVPIVNFNQK
jgi:regulator of protease activity HflC (stomatin/prohibitin superfamily)